MENAMDDMHGGHCGPQLYLLSEAGYESLRDLQAMLTLMAQIAYSPGNDDGSTALMLGRAELSFVFEAINSRIDDVLNRLSRENDIGSHRPVWQ
jgi:diacylglycerol kinase